MVPFEPEPHFLPAILAEYRVIYLDTHRLPPNLHHSYHPHEQQETSQPSVPAARARLIPRITSPDAGIPPILTHDLASTSHPGRVPRTSSIEREVDLEVVYITATSDPDTRPFDASEPQVTASGSDVVALRSEIEDLLEQVRLLQLRDAIRRRGSELESYEPPFEYSPRGLGYQS